mmetsp:Transcript_8371/g.21133  ORF Transcript_8371/g.21133 Transcript_8371/m.21133 type:complete len:274 (+) Transcript_8371:123-944(+)
MMTPNSARSSCKRWAGRKEKVLESMRRAELRLWHRRSNRTPPALVPKGSDHQTIGSRTILPSMTFSLVSLQSTHHNAFRMTRTAVATKATRASKRNRTLASARRASEKGLQKENVPRSGVAFLRAAKTMKETKRTDRRRRRRRQRRTRRRRRKPPRSKMTTKSQKDASAHANDPKRVLHHPRATKKTFLTRLVGARAKTRRRDPNETTSRLTRRRRRRRRKAKRRRRSRSRSRATRRMATRMTVEILLRLKTSPGCAGGNARICIRNVPPPGM